MDSDNSEDDGFAPNAGEALEMGDDFDSEGDQQISDEEPPVPVKPNQSAANAKPAAPLKGQDV